MVNIFIRDGWSILYSAESGRVKSVYSFVIKGGHELRHGESLIVFPNQFKRFTSTIKTSWVWDKVSPVEIKNEFDLLFFKLEQPDYKFLNECEFLTRDYFLRAEFRLKV